MPERVWLSFFDFSFYGEKVLLLWVLCYNVIKTGLESPV